MFKGSEINNDDTFDFIKELFNFDRNLDINAIYYNQSTILGEIIVLGLYDEFEKFIDNIEAVKNEKKETKFNCTKRKSPYFKQQHKGIKLKRSVKTEIKDNINDFVGDLDVSRFFNMSEDKNDGDKIFELKKFIYYSLCIDPTIRKYLMRHYLLYFIKSSKFQEYKDIISLDTSSKNKKNKELINTFLMHIGEYKIIPYIFIDFKKNDGKTYGFTTCGETTLLNLLNFYFINNTGIFKVKKGKFSEALEKFYSIYPSMEAQLKNIENTTKAWLEVVSNLKKNDKEEKEVILYNRDGDLHNNIKNIIFIFKEILNVEEEDIEEILGKISSKNIQIVNINTKEIEFLLDDRFQVFFRPGHGEIIPINSNSRSPLRLKRSEDFSTLYYNIFDKIDYTDDYENQLGKEIYEILINNNYKNTILQIFLNSLTRLILVKENLKEIPENILNLTNLTYLNIYGGDLSLELPPSIGNLTKLTELNLHNNNLTNIPDTIGNLTNLTKLDLSYNKLSTIPDTIGLLTNLIELDLSKNNLTELPDWTKNLTNLRKLVLNNNKLTDLPDTIGLLTNLTSLNLNNNNFIKLPDSIGNLTKLTYLSLTRVNLLDVPDTIGSLTNLSSLLLDYNKLTELPDTIGNLTNLTTLYLRNNKLTDVPNTIRNLTNLDTVYLENNKLTDLPDTIGKLSNLDQLVLYNNELIQLPDTIGKLTNLITLNLSANKLTELPDTIGNLSNLSYLFLDNNKLTELPDTIGNLTNLTKLVLNNNKLIKIPDSIGNLNNLSELVLDNKLTKIPDRIRELPNCNLVLHR